MDIQKSDKYELHIGDYVQGVEVVGPNGISTKTMRGWVSDINSSHIHIQADDSYNGHRGTILIKDTVHLVIHRIPEWWKVDNRRIKPGSKVKHFKGNIYILDRYAQHVDLGDVAIYHKESNPSEIWVRDSIEFNSKNFDKNYDAEYRFTVLNSDNIPSI